MQLLLLVDRDRRVTYCSGDVSGFLGMKPDEVLGWGLSELLQMGLSAASDADPLNSVLKLVSDAAATARSVEVRAITPFPRHHRVTVFPPITAQNVTTIGITIEEVTAARDIEARRSNLLAGLSNELRDPVTALMGFVRLLLDSPGVDGDQRYWLENVQTCGQRLAAIARETRDVAALNRGNLRVEPEELNLDDAVGELSP